MRLPSFFLMEGTFAPPPRYVPRGTNIPSSKMRRGVVLALAVAAEFLFWY
jgi:hypothetical protein